MTVTDDELLLGDPAGGPSAGRLSRRTFLAGTAATAAGVAISTHLAFATPELPATGDVIVCVFLRGGADGLNMVAPWQMPSYRSLRPTIRVKDAAEVTGDPLAMAGRPLVAGGNVASFPLSGVFAMHPGMASLFNGPWTDGRLAVVHAVGLPAAESDTRSHFDAQRFWEFGTASFNYATGFLNRYLVGQSGTDRLVSVGRGSNLQRSLAGVVPAFSMGSIGGFNVQGFSNNTRARAALANWYDGGTGDLLLQTGANTMAALNSVSSVTWTAPQFQVQNGASYPTSPLGRHLREVAMLIRANLGLRCVAVDVDGWDTHEGMGAAEDPASYFRRRVADLSDSLAAFYRDLGGMNEVTLFTISEFGRTIDENGNGGTDHGRGSCMLVMGNRIRGGVHGSFVPAVVEGPEGDLAVLNDYRRVLLEVLTVRGGATDPSAIFPTYAPQAPLGLCLA